MKPVSGELVLLAAGEEASRQPFDVTEWTEPISVPWQAKLPVEQGQRLELWCQIVDNHGLVYASSPAASSTNSPLTGFTSASV